MSGGAQECHWLAVAWQGTTEEKHIKKWVTYAHCSNKRTWHRKRGAWLLVPVSAPKSEMLWALGKFWGFFSQGWIIITLFPQSFYKLF